MNPPTVKSEVVIRVYEGVEFEIVPLDTFGSSPLCGTASRLLMAQITVEEEEHEERVLHAKKARAAVKRPFGRESVS